MQSSSAAMALTLVAANNGWIPFEMAAAMVLGENVGTTITANLAALVGNVYAKRAARAHFIFNMFGVVWMILVFPFFLQGIDVYMQRVHGVSPLAPGAFESIPIALSIFHTAFNVINVLLLIWFTRNIARIVERLVPSSGEDDVFRLDYIGSNLVRTPELSILEARRELAKFGTITSRMSGFIQDLLKSDKVKKRNQLLEKVKHYEEITDRVVVEVYTFLSRVAEGNISESSSNKIRALLSVNNELETLGDIFYQMSILIERKRDSQTWFTEQQLKNLLTMYEKLDDAFIVMIENLESGEKEVDLDRARKREREINVERDLLRRSHLKSLETGHYDVQNSMRYAELFSSCEKAGDHILIVSAALAGEH